MLTVERGACWCWSLRTVQTRSPAGIPAAWSSALGCVLAEDVAADLDLPPFDKALVDGYAVRSADLRRPATAGSAIGEEIPAGRTPTRPLGPREAAVIMTGAPLPPGADAVVMIERTRPRAATVVIDEPDVRPGPEPAAAGREMRAGRGRPALAGERSSTPRPSGCSPRSAGPQVSVIPRPRVAIVPTGDELVEPDRVPGPGPDPQLERGDAPGLAVDAGAEAEILADRPRRARTARRDPRARARRPTCC